ncbi:MAG: triose-phosphate isomerase [Chlamydiota bacterium]
MKKRPVILGNWKMYKTNREAKAYFEALLPQLSEVKATVGIAVPFTAISLCKELAEGSSVMVGAQNMHSAFEGAFTGEIAGKMLSDAGAQFVILGHSERRTLFQESHEEIRKKVEKALNEELTVVLCIGETLEQRKAGYEEHLQEQLTSALGDLKKTLLSKVIVAYEPIWAIGTGVSASPKQAEETHQWIRSTLETICGKTAGKKIPLLYGGSVKKTNIENFLEQKHIDGTLVGGASLKAQEFASMIPH